MKIKLKQFIVSIAIFGLAVFGRSMAQAEYLPQGFDAVCVNHARGLNIKMNVSVRVRSNTMTISIVNGHSVTSPMALISKEEYSFYQWKTTASENQFFSVSLGKVNKVVSLLIYGDAGLDEASCRYLKSRQD